jgi:hypothetical protein
MILVWYPGAKKKEPKIWYNRPGLNLAKPLYPNTLTVACLGRDLAPKKSDFWLFFF